MSYWFDSHKKRLPADKDRRRKLTEAQREEIRKLHAEGWSQRKLARAYNVSRRLIQFVLFPERQAENMQRRQDRGGWKQYYDREKHAEAVRGTRRYKQKVLKRKED